MTDLEKRVKYLEDLMVSMDTDRISTETDLNTDMADTYRRMDMLDTLSFFNTLGVVALAGAFLFAIF